MTRVVVERRSVSARAEPELPRNAELGEKARHPELLVELGEIGLERLLHQVKVRLSARRA